MATKTETKSSNSVIKIMVILLTLTTVVVGYLLYQVFTSEALDKGNHKPLSSFFGEKEEKLFPLDEFTLKLADGNYARLSINIGYVGKDKDLEEKKPVLRDKVLFELMKMKTQDLEGTEIEKTKSLLIQKMNPLLKKSEIRHIYIDNLVMN